MKLTIASLTLLFAFSITGTSHAQFGSGTSAGLGPVGQTSGTASYVGETGFAHSLSDHQSGFVRSSAIGVSKIGEISYSRSIAQKQGAQTTGTNLQILNGSQGSHFSGGEIKAVGSNQLQVQGQSSFGPAGVQGGATLQGNGGLIQGNSFAITNQPTPAFVPRIIGRKPFWSR